MCKSEGKLTGLWGWEVTRKSVLYFCSNSPCWAVLTPGCVCLAGHTWLCQLALGARICEFMSCFWGSRFPQVSLPPHLQAQ